MALVSTQFGPPATFADLALGTAFRFDGLPAHQICFKVEGPTADQAWILLLGGGTGGVYPSPWYGAMADVRYGAVQAIDAAYRVTPTGPVHERRAGKPVFPGYLVERGGGRYGVIIEGRLCIDLATGKRFNSAPVPASVYDQWALRQVGPDQEQTLFQFPTPEGVAP